MQLKTAHEITKDDIQNKILIFNELDTRFKVIDYFEADERIQELFMGDFSRMQEEKDYAIAMVEQLTTRRKNDKY